MQTLNLTLPTCWQELTPAQLRYVFYLIACDKYAPAEVKTYVLFRWSHIEVVAPEGNGFVVKHEGKPLRLTAGQIAEVLPALSWLDRLPVYPVRLPLIGHCKAAAADLQGLPFEAFLYCDNLYQGYLHTNDSALLEQMAQVLYNVPEGKTIALQPEERISVFYWFASVKDYFGRRFTHFFHTAPVSPDTSNLQKELQESMDAQIRALTKGDITKEETVLKMDVWRALTELDAQAADAEEIKRQMHQTL